MPELTTTEHPYGWLSLLPPLLAIALAIGSRRVLPALLVGVAAAAVISTGGNPWAALPLLGEEFLWKSLADSDHLRVFAFTLLMGAMVGVMQQAGGMRGIVELLLPFARGRRGGQVIGWLLGLLIFFDDYANTLLLGTTLRPLTDRLGVSREKLAYVVDSTAAPVAGLALVSTWVAGEISYIAEGVKQLPGGPELDPFAIFVGTIPYRFYVLFALLFVLLVALSGRDFGPMLTAEREALARRRDAARNQAAPSESNRWWMAAVPVALVLLVTGWLLVATGRASWEAEGKDPAAASWMQVIGNSDSYLALVYGSLAGLTAAWLLSISAGVSGRRVATAALQGARLMLPALAILWLAWSLSAATNEEHLQTAAYLGGLIEGRITPLWLPSVVFLLASGVAFATGTSWGTMAILMPLVIGAAWNVLTTPEGPPAGDSPLFLATVGSVLAGAIFGDHCSPISDTTVLSSQASGCDHIAHVRTQMPYALVVGAVAVLSGTLPAAAGASAWLLLPVGAVALTALVFLFGRQPSSETEGNRSGQPRAPN